MAWNDIDVAADAVRQFRKGACTLGVVVDRLKGLDDDQLEVLAWSVRVPMNQLRALQRQQSLGLSAPAAASSAAKGR